MQTTSLVPSFVLQPGLAGNVQREHRAAERMLPCLLFTVAEARRLMRELAGRWKLASEIAEVACLVIGEMATNSVLHSGSPGMTVRVTLHERHLRAEVVDTGT
ncbi:ATP-binding protein [Streptomyces sp. RKAG293]|uniref:ATP-binding protein n=1 Tax=Streptomyces sp. RKAG293 TaxID=2893403 RepID=UPI0020333376|nr:ATP-binding protein [Streptomyces sp. RKAG293]MCM2422667.1 ATP-binding protein [Streptomyces sp. RKAG293]